MSNQYANLMRQGMKLPPEAKDATGRLVKYEPNDQHREWVLTLSANGVKETVIAGLLGIVVKTLHKYYTKEMDDGREVTTARMGAALVREGLAGNVAAQRYWLGTHGGPEWRIPKASDLMPDVFDSEESRDRETVHFYMPSNHRDEPETIDEGPVIEGDAVESEAA